MTTTECRLEDIGKPSFRSYQKDDHYLSFSMANTVDGKEQLIIFMTSADHMHGKEQLIIFMTSADHMHGKEQLIIFMTSADQMHGKKYRRLY
jgi:hypothetical protein